MVITPTVTLARKIYPFGVTKLITHKVHISLSAVDDCKHTNHLVEGNSAVDDEVLAVFCHIKIHILVHQAESDCFVAHKCLVVTFGVSNGFYKRQTVIEHVPHLVNVPLVVALFFENFNPKIGNTHTETVVETNSAIFDRSAKSGHSAHVFGNANRFWINHLHQRVGKLQICNCVKLNAIAEIFPLVKRIYIAVVKIHH